MARIFKVHETKARVIRWGVDYKDPVSGERVRRVVGNKTQAQDELVKVLSNIQRGTYEPPVSRQATLSNLFEEWKLHRSTKRSLHDDVHRWKWIERFFGADRIIRKITASDIARFRSWLPEQETRTGNLMKPASANRAMVLLKAALGIAVHPLRWIYENPATGLKLLDEDNQRRRVCSVDEFNRLLEYAPPKLGIAIVIGYELGMRIGEVAGLSWVDLDFDERTIFIAKTKNKKPRKVPMTDPVYAALKEWRAAENDDRVLTTTAVYLSARFSELTRDLGIKDLVFHDLRRTRATLMRRAGADLLSIKNLLGHKTWVMVERYQEMDVEDLRAALSTHRPRNS